MIAVSMLHQTIPETRSPCPELVAMAASEQEGEDSLSLMMGPELAPAGAAAAGAPSAAASDARVTLSRRLQARLRTAAPENWAA